MTPATGSKVAVAAILAALAAGVVWYLAGERASPDRAAFQPQPRARNDAVRAHPLDVASPPAASAASNRVAADIGPHGRSVRHLPIERELLRDGMLGERAIDALKSSSFDAFLTRFETENADAAEMSAAYRDELQGQLSRLPDSLRLDRFACGVELCIGSLRARKHSEDYRSWYAKLQGTSRLPVYLLTEVAIDRGDVEEHRLLISTSRQARAFSGLRPAAEADKAAPR